MRRKDPSHHRSSSGGQEDDFDALASILTPIDETQYWADVANETKKKEERDKAGAFWNTLEPVAEEFNKISTMQLPGSVTVPVSCLFTYVLTYLVYLDIFLAYML